jgi:hypothetical protein
MHHWILHTALSAASLLPRISQTLFFGQPQWLSCYLML